MIHAYRNLLLTIASVSLFLFFKGVTITDKTVKKRNFSITTGTFWSVSDP